MTLAGPNVGHVASFRALAVVPGAVPLPVVSPLRTESSMGCLAYLAAFYDGRFGLAPGPFALVYTLSGAFSFLGTLCVGRYANSAARLGPERLLVAGLAAALVDIGGVYFSYAPPLALAFTALLGASHATVAACVVSLLVACCGGLLGAALSLNTAGMSLGVFFDSAFGGAGLALAGDPERVGMVLFATMQGIAALINGGMIKPELLDGLVETAIEQFVRGARPA